MVSLSLDETNLNVMKKLVLIGAAIVALSFTDRKVPVVVTTPAMSETAMQQNRMTFLLDYYQKTSDQLEAQLKGLTSSQLQFQPSADRWSISQCVEHIILTEKMLFGMAKETLAQPANPERKNEVHFSDQQLIDGIVDRSHKAEASADLIGEGKYTDVATAMADFRAQREIIRKYLDGISADDLQNHISDSPFGAIDGYHSLLFVAGLTARHSLQIEEVKADPEFPR